MKLKQTRSLRRRFSHWVNLKKRNNNNRAKGELNRLILGENNMESIGLSFIASAVTFLIGYLSFMKNRDKDTVADAQREAILETKLNMIANGVNTLILDQKDINKRLSSLSEHAIRNDERVRQAHERIDKLEERVDNGKN